MTDRPTRSYNLRSAAVMKVNPLELRGNYSIWYLKLFKSCVAGKQPHTHTYTNGHYWKQPTSIRYRGRVRGSEPTLAAGQLFSSSQLHYQTTQTVLVLVFLSASLYFSKRGAYWDRLCRDVVGRWLVVTRVHCDQTVHPRPIVTMEH